jgi:hypothetical protein
MPPRRALRKTLKAFHDRTSGWTRALMRLLLDELQSEDDLFSEIVRPLDRVPRKRFSCSNLPRKLEYQTPAGDTLGRRRTVLRIVPETRQNSAPRANVSQLARSGK